MDCEHIFKDPVLKGIYVRRCKCGNRPYYDRIQEEIPEYGCWIACNCKMQGEVGVSKEEAIKNWNDGKIKHVDEWVAISMSDFNPYDSPEFFDEMMNKK